MTSKGAAIALVAAAVLVFQVATTRILSVVLWYHFAFLSVSLAMLGLGAPGVWIGQSSGNRVAGSSSPPAWGYIPGSGRSSAKWQRAAFISRAGSTLEVRGVCQTLHLPSRTCGRIIDQTNDTRSPK